MEMEVQLNLVLKVENQNECFKNRNMYSNKYIPYVCVLCILHWNVE
jgi:hypothetical protein